MGHVQYVWDLDIELQRQVATLETKRQRLATPQQTQTTSKIRGLHSRIEELEHKGTRLQQQLRETQAPAPPAITDTSNMASADKASHRHVVNQLGQDCRRLRGERNVLRQHVDELKATNTELGRNLQQANIAIALCQARLFAPPATPHGYGCPLGSFIDFRRGAVVEWPKTRQPHPDASCGEPPPILYGYP